MGWGGGTWPVKAVTVGDRRPCTVPADSECARVSSLLNARPFATYRARARCSRCTGKRWRDRTKVQTQLKRLGVARVGTDSVLCPVAARPMPRVSGVASRVRAASVCATALSCHCHWRGRPRPRRATHHLRARERVVRRWVVGRHQDRCVASRTGPCLLASWWRRQAVSMRSAHGAARSAPLA